MTYDIVYPVTEPRQLDPENEQDALQILLAGQLTRIVCRAVELIAFSWLQKELFNLRNSQKAEHKTVDFLQQLGRTLLTLRWRVSWWETVESTSSGDEGQRQSYIDRIQGLCRILYIYFFIVRRKLPAGSGQDLVSKNGLYSEYPDAEPVFETLPYDETLHGFEQWMMGGYDMIKQADVEQKLDKLHCHFPSNTSPRPP